MFTPRLWGSNLSPMNFIDLKISDAHIMFHNSHGQLKKESLDLYIHEGRIHALGSGHGLQAIKEWKAKGLTVLPGLIDSQVHFREPGYTHKEDLQTGSEGALLGGITSVFEMPNTQPPTVDEETLADKLTRARGRMYTHYAFYLGGSNQNFEHIHELEKHPQVPGIKVFMGSSFGDLLIDQESLLEEFFKRATKPIVVHAENQAMMEENKKRMQPTRVSQHHEWRSVEACLKATQTAVRLAQKYGKRLHVLHITSADEVLFLKDQGPLVTFEILPQHLTFSAPEAYERWGSLVQQNPPIREKKHQDVLWQAITQGWATTLGSDHAPHTLEEKMRPYPASPSGMPGVQTLLPLMLTHVHHGRLSLERLVELMTTGVRRIFPMLGKGLLQPGFDADLTIVDLNKKWTITNSWIRSRVGWTPLDGFQAVGYPTATLLRGRMAQQEGELLLPPQGEAITFLN
ncbi:MAG: dihydroorotase [Bdellovibrionaceae bacterium]|nr:dihydroorotase [Pseudobdellovibrionaceae bacterium]